MNQPHTFGGTLLLFIFVALGGKYKENVDQLLHSSEEDLLGWKWMTTFLYFLMVIKEAKIIYSLVMPFFAYNLARKYSPTHTNRNNFEKRAVKIHWRRTKIFIFFQYFLKSAHFLFLHTADVVSKLVVTWTEWKGKYLFICPIISYILGTLK